MPQRDTNHRHLSRRPSANGNSGISCWTRMPDANFNIACTASARFSDRELSSMSTALWISLVDSSEATATTSCSVETAERHTSRSTSTSSQFRLRSTTKRNNAGGSASVIRVWSTSVNQTARSNQLTEGIQISNGQRTSCPLIASIRRRDGPFTAARTRALQGCRRFRGKGRESGLPRPSSPGQGGQGCWHQGVGQARADRAAGGDCSGGALRWWHHTL